ELKSISKKKINCSLDLTPAWDADLGSASTCYGARNRKPQKALRAWGGAFRSTECLASPGERRLVRSGDGVGPRLLQELKPRPGRRAGWSSLQPQTGSGTRRSMARPAVIVLALATVLLLGVATVSRSKGPWGKDHQGTPRIPSQFSQEERVAMKEALKSAIRIPTVSFSPKELNTTALAEFGRYICTGELPTVERGGRGSTGDMNLLQVFKASFIQHEVVGEYSHLFTVQGSDPSLQPYMLLAHSAVVPAPAEGWEVPPFSGLERDGFIYG
ncbi:hypothetical protein MC885_008736, partial [Smutsia gigantea]